ncbi:hypothetical protein [Viscerimonas tarda]
MLATARTARLPAIAAHVLILAVAVTVWVAAILTDKLAFTIAILPTAISAGCNYPAGTVVNVHSARGTVNR